jgi:hypothetical protein
MPLGSGYGPGGPRRRSARRAMDGAGCLGPATDQTRTMNGSCRLGTANERPGGRAPRPRCCGRQSGRRSRADGHRDDKEDAEDPQEKAERLESVSSARPAPDQDPRAAGQFSTELGASMVVISSSSRQARTPHQFSRWGGVLLVGVHHLVNSTPFGSSSRCSKRPSAASASMRTDGTWAGSQTRKWP